MQLNHQAATLDLGLASSPRFDLAASKYKTLVTVTSISYLDGWDRDTSISCCIGERIGGATETLSTDLLDDKIICVPATSFQSS